MVEVKWIVLAASVAAMPAKVFAIWMYFSGSVPASFWSRSRNPLAQQLLDGPEGQRV